MQVPHMLLPVTLLLAHAENLTIEDWWKMTEGWAPFSKGVAIHLRKTKSFRERQEFLHQYMGAWTSHIKQGNIPEEGAVMSFVIACMLPDAVLDTVISSFDTDIRVTMGWYVH